MNEKKEEAEDVETIYIGSKPLMRYVMAGMSIFMDEHPEHVRIAARGRAISRAVDTAEVLRTRYLKGLLELEDVQIDTDEVKNKKTGNIDRVSSINIMLKTVRTFPAAREKKQAQKR